MGVVGSLRETILLRDNNMCRVCGEVKELQIHHIKPISDGGDNNINNLTALCRNCHHIFHSSKKFKNKRSLTTKKIMIKENNLTFSIYGNKWGRKEHKIDNDTIEKIKKDLETISIRKIAAKYNIKKNKVEKIKKNSNK